MLPAGNRSGARRARKRIMQQKASTPCICAPWYNLSMKRRDERPSRPQVVGDGRLLVYAKSGSAAIIAPWREVIQMGRTTIRTTKTGTRITTRVKSGNTTVTRTTGAGKKPRTTTSTRVGKTTYTNTR